MKPRVLYICQEIEPYVESSQGGICRRLAQSMQEKGYEIRTFMPRYGCVNERRNQLHEVIRLSGMNLIIGGSDHQLIIKVASIPAARVQVYFIDNDDYFSRKATVVDASGAPFADNGERAVFFARGVIETVRRLGWNPQIVHCHGWLSAIVPLYLKHVFHDDPLFANLKVVVSLYDGFKGKINIGEHLDAEKIETGLGEVDFAGLKKLLASHADRIIEVSEGEEGADIDYSKIYEEIL